MARSPLRVCRIGDDDHASFVDLWVRRRVEGGASPEAAWLAAREGRLATVLDHDDVVVFLASAGHEPVGYVIASVAPLSLLTEHISITAEDVYVAPEHRGRGVSVALLRALANHAERSRIGHVGVNVSAADRGAHRTLARLGFAPTVTRRMSTTAALLRRLESGDQGRRALQASRADAAGRG